MGAPAVCTLRGATRCAFRGFISKAPHERGGPKPKRQIRVDSAGLDRAGSKPRQVEMPWPGVVPQARIPVPIAPARCAAEVVMPYATDGGPVGDKWAPQCKI